MKTNSKLKWILILLGVIVLGLLFQTREGFEGTPIVQQTPTEEYATPTCPNGTMIDSTNKCMYPGQPEMFTCPSGYIPTARRTCLKQGSTEEIPPQCPAGKVFDNRETNAGCIQPFATPSCPSGYTLRTNETRDICVKPISSPSSSSSSSTPPASSSGSSSPAAASTGSKFSQRIWGPQFNELGPRTGDGNGDTTKTTTYPQLLGGDAGKYEGGDGSKIQLPSLGSLGLNADANFFPFSRSPGDMELIADPYRVSSMFSAASYSPTPAPAPFLTDFSAFQ